jgi:hypothetical protein
MGYSNPKVNQDCATKARNDLLAEPIRGLEAGARKGLSMGCGYKRHFQPADWLGRRFYYILSMWLESQNLSAAKIDWPIPGYDWMSHK